MRHSPLKIVLVTALAVLAACQSPDVGQPCALQWGSESSGAPPPPDPVQLYESGGADFFESGNVSCENLVCIVSPAPAGSKYSTGGYCSKPCVSNQDCFQSETKLECRQMVLDPVFLAQLPPDVKERYLGEVQFSNYCAVP
jgi:hypothetical protein